MLGILAKRQRRKLDAERHKLEVAAMLLATQNGHRLYPFSLGFSESYSACRDCGAKLWINTRQEPQLRIAGGAIETRCTGKVMT